ncbi:MAG: YhcH/YjgK/YiaL family protein [Clostridia bacterium]|nr:YhcH/YjgK/YiaL family protein [Clostridia bacterium]
MIFDTLNRLNQYKGICPGLDKLIDFTLSHELNALPAGRNEIDGDLAWMNVNVAPLVPETDLYERHMEHLDLQIPLDEGEIITVRPVEELEWDFEGETGFTHGPAGTPLHMVPGTFAVFFPGDAHNCGISEAGQTSCRKLVGKARI